MTLEALLALDGEWILIIEVATVLFGFALATPVYLFGYLANRRPRRPPSLESGPEAARQAA